MTYVLRFIALISLFVGANCFANTPEWINKTTHGRVKTQDAQHIAAAVHHYSEVNELDPNLVFKIIKVESGYNIKARSNKNARGLMQVVPKYHKDKIKGRNLHNVAVNIEVGTSILREYIDKYGSVNLGLRAYYGDHKSDWYPNLVTSVRFEDELEAQSNLASAEFNLDELIYKNPPNSGAPELTLKERVDRHRQAKQNKTNCKTQREITTCVLEG